MYSTFFAAKVTSISDVKNSLTVSSTMGRPQHLGGKASSFLKATVKRVRRHSRQYLCLLQDVWAVAGTSKVSMQLVHLQVGAGSATAFTAGSATAACLLGSDLMDWWPRR